MMFRLSKESFRNVRMIQTFNKSQSHAFPYSFTIHSLSSLSPYSSLLSSSSSLSSSYSSFPQSFRFFSSSPLSSSPSSSVSSSFRSPPPSPSGGGGSGGGSGGGEGGGNKVDRTSFNAHLRRVQKQLEKEPRPKRTGFDDIEDEVIPGTRRDDRDDYSDDEEALEKKRKKALTPPSFTSSPSDWICIYNDPEVAGLRRWPSLIAAQFVFGLPMWGMIEHFGSSIMPIQYRLCLIGAYLLYPTIQLVISKATADNVPHQIWARTSPSLSSSSSYSSSSLLSSSSSSSPSSTASTSSSGSLTRISAKMKKYSTTHRYHSSSPPSSSSSSPLPLHPEAPLFKESEVELSFRFLALFGKHQHHKVIYSRSQLLQSKVIWLSSGEPRLVKLLTVEKLPIEFIPLPEATSSSSPAESDSATSSSPSLVTSSTSVGTSASSGSTAKQQEEDDGTKLEETMIYLLGRVFAEEKKERLPSRVYELNAKGFLSRTALECMRRLKFRDLLASPSAPTSSSSSSSSSSPSQRKFTERELALLDQELDENEFEALGQQQQEGEREGELRNSGGGDSGVGVGGNHLEEGEDSVEGDDEEDPFGNDEKERKREREKEKEKEKERERERGKEREKKPFKK